jgi:cation diffusion facilitator family transporter
MKKDCSHDQTRADNIWSKNKKKSLTVVLITVVMMTIEIYYGYITGSMGLLADGWHMATHAAALGITFLTYHLASSQRLAKNFNFGGGKILFLGGFASSLLLFFVAISVIYESVLRLIRPNAIAFNEAIGVAVIGLIVNLVCAWVLKDEPHSHSLAGDKHSHDDHHHNHGHDRDHAHAHNHSHTDHHHHADENYDLNMKGAFLHVVADALTSITAIAALVLAKYMGWIQLDPLIGAISAIVILRWAWGLFKEASWELLDGTAKNIDYAKLRNELESKGSKIVDIHIWRVAPSTLNCELIIESKEKLGVAFYRNIIESKYRINHSVIEERSV